MFADKKIESYFSDRLICGRTSRQIYRLALALLSLETLSSLNKLKISLFNAHLPRFVRRYIFNGSMIILYLRFKKNEVVRRERKSKNRKENDGEKV